MLIKRAFNLSTGKLHKVLRAVSAICETAVFRSHPRRWARVAAAGKPTWDRRNEIIAGFIPPESSVLDLGAGAQTMRTHLHPSCEYQPCDLVKSSPEVILCDFNAGQYPPSSLRFSHVICSGVLEYMREPSVFMKNISICGDNLLLSYNPLHQGVSLVQRMKNHWCNHLQQSELEDLFRDSGLDSVLLHISENGELIYHLKRTNPSINSV